MALKRYELYGSHVGVLEQESECGPWVSAVDALTEIGNLKAAARRVIKAHDNGTIARGPSDSVSIEALRELVKE